MYFKEPTVEEIKKAFPKYQNITFHRKGGFKAVYFGELNGIKEAIKLVFIPNPENVNEEEKTEIITENIKRVKRELKILNECHSPFIVKLGKLFPIDVIMKDQSFIAYSEEFLNGQDLSEIIQQGFIPSEEELKTLVICLIHAIRELWFELPTKIVHRDIKPLNIIKTDNKERKFVLLDFGIAYSLRETSLTFNPSNIPGSLLYLAPEMLQPNFRESIDYRSDIYTIGLTAYEYASRKHPFARHEDMGGQTITRILREKPASLQELRNDLSESFCSIIDQMLKKKPALRPSNLERLISTLEMKS